MRSSSLKSRPPINSSVKGYDGVADFADDAGSHLDRTASAGVVLVLTSRLRYEMNPRNARTSCGATHTSGTIFAINKRINRSLARLRRDTVRHDLPRIARQFDANAFQKSRCRLPLRSVPAAKRSGRAGVTSSL